MTKNSFIAEVTFNETDLQVCDKNFKNCTSYTFSLRQDLFTVSNKTRGKESNKKVV